MATSDCLSGPLQTHCSAISAGRKELFFVAAEVSLNKCQSNEQCGRNAGERNHSNGRFNGAHLEVCELRRAVVTGEDQELVNRRDD